MRAWLARHKAAWWNLLRIATIGVAALIAGLLGVFVDHVVLRLAGESIPAGGLITLALFLALGLLFLDWVDGRQHGTKKPE